MDLAVAIGFELTHSNANPSPARPFDLLGIKYGHWFDQFACWTTLWIYSSVSEVRLQKTGIIRESRGEFDLNLR